jgi:hypothetical protein
MRQYELVNLVVQSGGKGDLFPLVHFTNFYTAVD